MRKLAKLEVSDLGYGAMGLSGVYGSVDDKQSIQLLKDVYSQGITFFDTADVYGNGHNEQLLGNAFKGMRADVIIATKCAITWDVNNPTEMQVSNKPDYIRKAIDVSLQRLQTDYVDLYYLHRIDPTVPIEDSVGTLADLVSEGKIRHIGLSEASAETIGRAHKVHPITAVQSEYSLWSRDIEHNGVFAVLKELNIGLVAYSPLGRGFLTGNITSTTQYDKNDFRNNLPRFQGEDLQHNLKLITELTALAAQKNCSIAQLALVWVLSQGQHIVPIPGSRNLSRVEENFASRHLVLSEHEKKMLDDLFSNNVIGSRYPEKLMKTVNI